MDEQYKAALIKRYTNWLNMAVRDAANGHFREAAEAQVRAGELYDLVQGWCMTDVTKRMNEIKFPYELKLKKVA